MFAILITPPARRVWRKYKFAFAGFFYVREMSQKWSLFPFKIACEYLVMRSLQDGRYESYYDAFETF